MTNKLSTSALSLIVVVLLATSSLLAQEKRTIPERVRKAKQSLRIIRMNSSEPIPLSVILDRTELVVRARIGPSSAHLSADQQSIYSTYELIDPKILIGSFSTVAKRPGEVVPPLRVTMPGGTVQVGEYTAALIDHGVAKLVPGAEVVLLLQRHGDEFWPATNAGVFGVIDSRITPLLSEEGGHKQFAGKTPEAFVDEIAKLKSNVVGHRDARRHSL